MPDNIHAPLAHRIGPSMAGAIKTMARRYHERDGLSFREIAAKIATDHGVPLTHASVRVWAVKGNWASPAAKTPGLSKGDRSALRKQEMTAKGAKDGAVKCRRRCPMCFQLVESGETHICLARAETPRGRLTIFAGGYL